MPNVLFFFFFLKNCRVSST